MRPFTMRVINSARSHLFSASLLIMVVRQWREGERIISSRYVSEYPSSSFFFFFFGSLLIIVRFFRFPDLIPQVARLKQFLTRFRLFLSSSLSSFILDVSIYSFIRSIREYASVTVKRRCRKGVIFFFF